MPRLFNWIMNRRAWALTTRLRRFLAGAGRVADIGSGTGHNAACWREMLGLEVREYDVADLHWVGVGPILWDGVRLPAANAEYDMATLLFVLQYAPHPTALLQEVRRVCSGRVLIVQSTYQGGRGYVALLFRELVWGRLAFYAARLARVILRQDCRLVPRRSFTREELRRTIDRAGFRIVSWEPDEWNGLNVSRDLYVLEPIGSNLPSPSLSPPAMRNAVSVEH
jgi:ubiquinone/menaquinone biosynthesis C-methylase UbiE